VAGVLAASAAVAVHAKPLGDPADPDDPVPSCLSQLTLLRLVATPSTVQSGSSTTLSYSVRIPKGCSGVTLDLGGGPIASPQGSLRVQPLRPSAYVLHASLAGQTRQLASVMVSVTGPPPSP